MRQIGNDEFVPLLNQTVVGKLNKLNKNILKWRFTDGTHCDYPHETVFIYAENTPVDDPNKEMFERLEASLSQIKDIDE